jgi:hypothetical protein
MFKLIFIALIAQELYGQPALPQYYILTKKADSLYKINNYKNSAFTYSQAFKSNGWKGYQEDRYNAARSWTLAGYLDSAIFNLERIVSKLYYDDYERITTDKDFISLYNNPRWKLLITKIKSYQRKDKKLSSLLDSLAKEDQKWRNLLTKFRNNEIPKDSIDEKTIEEQIILTDYLNFIKVKKIFYSHGFPNYDLVGVKGSHNFWYIVQHQDWHVEFQDSVLIAMKPEAEKGKASWTDYAYLIDRVKCNKRELQIYGTQMKKNKEGTSYEPKPVIEPEKLNERRKSIGLSTIEDYIKLMETNYYGSISK